MAQTTPFGHFVSRPNDPQQFHRLVFDGDGAAVGIFRNAYAVVRAARLQASAGKLAKKLSRK
jgi:hypothetical protein